MATRRIVLAVCAVALAYSASPATAVLPAPPPAPVPAERIAPNVTAAGADMSGLTIEEAIAKLEATFGESLKRNISVKAARRSFGISAKTAKLKFDAPRTAQRALNAGRKLPTTPPAPGAAPQGVDVALAVTLSRSAVRRFAGRVDDRVSRKARNSKLRITLRRVWVTHSKPGRTIDHRALAKGIVAAFADPRLERIFSLQFIKVKARIDSFKARRRARTVITIHRRTFTLRLFKNLKRRRSYKVAVGMPAYPTPKGRFRIRSKQVNPTWSVPNSPWAGELAGSSVAGGSAANPLKARWMGITGSVGIHGTSQDYSIGSRASHGCIRMHVWDVIALYKRVPVGSHVLIR